MNSCQHYAVYLAAERDGLRRAISENRRSLSLRTGHEVAEAVAKQDFLDRLLGPFACEFRLNYCKACPLGERCDVRFCARR